MWKQYFTNYCNKKSKINIHRCVIDLLDIENGPKISRFENCYFWMPYKII